MRVLATGALGMIGSRVLPLLRERFDLIPTDVKANPDDPTHRRLDLRDMDATVEALRDVDAVVNLAIAGWQEYRPDVRAFDEAQIEVNVRGAYHVLEAARQTGVERVVLVSTAMVQWGCHIWPGRELQVREGPKPTNLYGCTKVFCEAVGEMYSRLHGMQIACVRIGQPMEITASSDQLRKQRPNDGACLASYEDIAGALACALTASDLTFAVFNAISDGPRRGLELDAGRRLVGYEPQHRFSE